MEDGLREKIEDQLRRLVIAERDLVLTHRYALYLLENDLLPASNPDEQLLRYAFQTSLVVTYSRQFQDSRGGSSTVPDTLFNRHLRVFDSDQKDLHEKVLELRNTIYAHSDGDEFDVRFEKIYLKEIDISWILPESKNPYVPFDKNDTKTLIKMIDLLRESVSNHKDELEAKLFPDEST